MRNAYAKNNYAEAKEALQKIFRQLERINPSAARSLEEGLEETQPGNQHGCVQPSGAFFK
jgi:putative transposase